MMTFRIFYNALRDFVSRITLHHSIKCGVLLSLSRRYIRQILSQFSLSFRFISFFSLTPDVNYLLYATTAAAASPSYVCALVSS
jgi:hypothetical protein